MDPDSSPGHARHVVAASDRLTGNLVTKPGSASENEKFHSDIEPKNRHRTQAFPAERIRGRLCQGPAMGTRLDLMSEQPAPSPTSGSPLPAEIASALKKDSAGLVAAIVQQFDTHEVLMLGWMDDEALHRTLTTGRVTFYSRSRQEYWRKGDTSGHVQWVEVRGPRLRRRRPPGAGGPGRRGLPHRHPHLLRRPGLAVVAGLQNSPGG